jgi:plastocyanin
MGRVAALSIARFWGATSGRADQKPTPQAHEIMIQGFMYHPDAVTVHVGDTVQWKNADIVPHTVTTEDKSFNSGSIAPGATWKLAAKKAGTFLYRCTPHPNMHGKLIVKEPMFAAEVFAGAHPPHPG